MATEVNLPALGESVTEGTVTRWLKQVGDTVAVDEALLEVSTDKVDTEIPSPVAGTLLEIKAKEDETVEVGAVLGVIGDEGESSRRAPAASPSPRPSRGVRARAGAGARARSPSRSEEARAGAGARAEKDDGREEPAAEEADDADGDERCRRSGGGGESRR